MQPVSFLFVFRELLVRAAGKLEAASRIPADLQLQLQQAQQQNQTLARILAERCEQAAVHVERQHQLQEVWQQLIDMQAVPSGCTVQVSLPKQSHNKYMQCVCVCVCVCVCMCV